MSDMGTLIDTGERTVLRFERVLPHPVERAWRLVTEPEGLARWFPARTSFEAFEVGARVTYTFEQADIDRATEAGVEDVPLESTGHIRAIEAHRLFELDWLGEILRFELEPHGEGCRLVFTHVFDRDPEQAPLNAAGWHVCLDALAGHSAPEERTEALRASYRARFHSER